MFQGKLPLSGIHVNRVEDSDTIKNAFEISGPLIERIVVVCQGPTEANKWVELLTSVEVKKSQEAVKRLASGNAPTPPPHVSFNFILTLIVSVTFVDLNV